MSLRTSIHPPVRMGKDKKEINLPTVDHGVDIIGDEWEIDMVVSVNVKKEKNENISTIDRSKRVFKSNKKN